jgi:hypothetical protein
VSEEGRKTKDGKMTGFAEKMNDRHVQRHVRLTLDSAALINQMEQK